MTKNENKEKICHICGKQFELLKSLEIHIRTVHEGIVRVLYPSKPSKIIQEQIKPWFCEYCGKSFSNENTLNEHLVCIHKSVHEGVKNSQ